MSGTEFEGYEALVSELRATTPVAPEELRQRVLELGPSGRRRTSKRRRLVYVVVPVAVVLAVGAALVHGFVSSSSRNSESQPVAAALAGNLPVQRGPAHRAIQTTSTPAAGSAYYGQSKTAKRLAPTAQNWNSAASGGKPLVQSGSLLDLTAREAVTIPQNRLVHANASLEVSVKSHDALTKATNNATKIVSSLGGYAQSVSYQSSHGGSGDAVLELRVPVQKAEIAIGKLAGLGTLLSQQVSTKDLQAQLNSQNNGIGSLKRAIAVYSQALKSGTLTGSERVQIQIKLSNARHAITQLRRNRTATLQSGATSNISLLLTTRKHAFGVPHHHGSTRVGRLLGSAAHFLALEGIIVLYALIVVAPLLIVGGLAWWAVRERRRREERLLASA